MTSTVLAASQLRFGYRRRRPVFNDLTWSVKPGSRTLLLGPNGAGKSTLLKLMSGQLRPKHGTVTFGDASSRRTLFRHVGWMPQHIEALRGFTVREQVEFAAWVGGRSAADARSAASEALPAVRLDERPDEPVAHLSGGQMRRLGLAQILARDSSVLLLDEPTAGLDPAQTINFREILRSIDAPGGIVISTHQVSDLINDVDRVAVLVDGDIRFDGTVEEFASQGSSSDDGESFAQIFVEFVNGGLH